MRYQRSKQPKQEPPGVRERLVSLRSSLLRLHKALIVSERMEYEKIIGKIQSPNHFLQLLTHDPWFAWLSPLSQMIVSIDESLDGEEALTEKSVENFVNQSTLLLVAAESGSGFPRHYHEALQRDPHVILAHAEVAKLRGSRKAPE